MAVSDISSRQAVNKHWLRIWDLPTRLFHWLLVLAISVAAYTGFLGSASQLDFHIWAGYCIGALVILRLIWGLFGSEYSRLDRLFGALPEVPAHLNDLRRMAPKHYAGHNPAGSLMILGLFAVLLGIVTTGMIVLGGQEKQGILDGVTSYAIGNSIKSVHQIIAYLLLAMIAGHLAGVVIETVLLRVPLVQGMVTGWLPEGGEGAASRLRQTRPALALICSTLVAAAMAGAALPLSSLPALGVPQPVSNPAYIKECGSCHWPFHPSLLPRASWKAILSSLDQHFGEDATLPDKTAAEIAAYLDANAAETADTEPANRFRQVNPQDPRRITATPAWQRLHHHFSDKLFASAAIKTRSNCAACHRDALTGRFDDQRIDVPHSSQAGANP